MTGRRQSARIASQNNNSSPPQPQSQPKSSPAGRKRKNEANGSSRTPKRGKKDAEPKQKTLEETIVNEPEESQPAPAENGVEPQAKSESDHSPAENDGAKPAKPDGEGVADEPEDAKMTGTNGDHDPPVVGTAQPKEDINPEETAAEKPDEKPDENPDEKPEQGQEPKTQGEAKSPLAEESKLEETEEVKQETTNGNAVIPKSRGDEVPSSILEKGIIYFFYRARVNVNEPQDVKDIARTYIILRPIPLDAKLGDGPIGDDGSCRLLSLPKKVLPRSGKDRFMTFVEKTKTSFNKLKDSFMSGSEYATKTAGTSHVPPVTPLAEGVYAITSTGRESHLAYIITIPSELGEVQKDLGLKERGSFVTSVKNPSTPAPNNVSLPQGPDYPKEMLDDFRGLRWKPLEPRYLDYPNTQFLVIGESYDSAVEQRPKDERENNALASSEIEKLEGEDEIRVKHLKGDDAVFADLGITSKEYPEVPTTW